jgi:hypothetical protein
MPFNATDSTQPPFTQGIMTLTHDECVMVKEKCQVIIENFVPDIYNPAPSEHDVVSTYNIECNFEEAINGDTYSVLTAYDTEYNTQGINENGIIPEPVEETPEEEQTEEETPVEDVEETPEGETIPEEENAPEEATEAPAVE